MQARFLLDYRNQNIILFSFQTAWRHMPTWTHMVTELIWENNK